MKCCPSLFIGLSPLATVYISLSSRHSLRISAAISNAPPYKT
ncbi:MAG: hypothetical protein N3G79_04110 [Sulfolobales archaeon]|nr:hypothetical protein [Sulfolobales archaeon]